MGGSLSLQSLSLGEQSPKLWKTCRDEQDLELMRGRRKGSGGEGMELILSYLLAASPRNHRAPCEGHAPAAALASSSLRHTTARSTLVAKEGGAKTAGSCTPPACGHPHVLAVAQRGRGRLPCSSGASTCRPPRIALWARQPRPG